MTARSEGTTPASAPVRFPTKADVVRHSAHASNGHLLPDSAQALLYAYFRRAITRALYEPVVGKRAWAWLTSEEVPSLGRMITQWLANVSRTLDEDRPAAILGDRSWNDVLPSALASAWTATVKKAGSDPAKWRWADHHRTNAQHTLAPTFPELAPAINPTPVAVGGDSDTIQCSGYGWSGRKDFDVSNLSVYRQVVDFAEPEQPSFVIPGGVWAMPGTEHYNDQLEHWRTHRRIPAHLKESDVESSAVHRLTLRPA